MSGLDSSPELDGALPVVTSSNEFGFVWKKQAKFYKSAVKQLRAKVRVKF
jgi:hypothetical protein